MVNVNAFLYQRLDMKAGMAFQWMSDSSALPWAGPANLDECESFSLPAVDMKAGSESWGQCKSFALPRPELEDEMILKAEGNEKTLLFMGLDMKAWVALKA